MLVTQYEQLVEAARLQMLPMGNAGGIVSSDGDWWSLMLKHVVMCMLQLTERQYTWIALSARTRLRRWQEIERLFQTKVCE